MLLSDDEFFRTSATVNREDFKLFKALANLKYDTDPLNSAWQEAVKLFNERYAKELTEAVEKIDSLDNK